MSGPTYPPDWPKVSERRKDEAGRRCARCGHPDDPDWYERHDLDSEFVRGYQRCDEECSHPGAEPGSTPRKRRILTVHHLDGDPSNLRWWNLAVLCQACHLAVQGRVSLEQTWSEPHSDWFLLHAAGYYAEEVAGERVTREEARDELVRLLAIGQPHLEEHYRERLEEAG